MLDLFEDPSVAGEELVVFGSSFERAGFLAEGADVQDVFGAGVEKLIVELLFQARFSGDSAKSFVTAGQGVLGGTDAHFVDLFPCFVRGFLHGGAQQVVGNDHHFERLVRHVGSLDGEVFHAEGGLEIAEFDLDLPAFHVEVGDFFGGVFHGIQKVGDDDKGGFFSSPVFVAHLDIAQGEFVGKVLPLSVGEFAGFWFSGGLLPGDEALDGADFFSSAPVEFTMPGLVKTHHNVAFALGGDPRDVFIGAEGAVAEVDVALVDVFEQARGHPSVVFLEAAGFESFDSSMAEIDHADDAHDGEATADFLAGVLGVDRLVRRGVHQGDAGAVDGFENMSAPEVTRLGAPFEDLPDLPVEPVEKAVLDTLSGTAVSAEGIVDEALSKGMNRGLCTTLGGGKYGVREAGKDGLMVHTSKPYPSQLFVLFYQENFSEIVFKSVPFVSGTRVLILRF